MIRSCNGCVAPKRHPGCHATCEDYLKEKAQDEAERAALRKDNEYYRYRREVMKRGRH